MRRGDYCAVASYSVSPNPRLERVRSSSVYCCSTITVSPHHGDQMRSPSLIEILDSCDGKAHRKEIRYEASDL